MYDGVAHHLRKWHCPDGPWAAQLDKLQREFLQSLDEMANEESGPSLKRIPQYFYSTLAKQ